MKELLHDLINKLEDEAVHALLALAEHFHAKKQQNTAAEDGPGTIPPTQGPGGNGGHP